MGFWSSLGSSALDSSVGGIMGNIGMVDYEINPLARAGYEDYWNDSYSIQSKYQYQNAQQLAALQYGYYNRSLAESTKLRRQGLESAGFNPILAVNSAAGAPFSPQMPGAPSSPGPSPQAGRALASMNYAQQAAMLDQTNAQTEFIKQKTLGEGWQIKTLSRSEAQGLGANLVHTLGFNFHDSSQQTFLVAYNPITGELRNLGDTDSGLGSTAPVTNAAQVNAIPIDWNTDKSPRYKFNPDDWELKPQYRK